MLSGRNINSDRSNLAEWIRISCIQCYFINGCRVLRNSSNSLAQPCLVCIQYLAQGLVCIILIYKSNNLQVFYIPGCSGGNGVCKCFCIGAACSNSARNDSCRSLG